MGVALCSGGRINTQQGSRRTVPGSRKLLQSLLSCQSGFEFVFLANLVNVGQAPVSPSNAGVGQTEESSQLSGEVRSVLEFLVILLPS